MGTFATCGNDYDASMLISRNGQEFEFEFHPGAAGQVGYELYVHRKERDGHNLLFGNIGPEVIMYVTQNPSYRIPEDLTYIASTSGVPMLIFVGNNSPIQTIEELVEEGRNRTVNISTSRLPHPATIGALALGDELGADFNLKMGRLRREFLEREAKVYFQTYQEVVSVVEQYAKWHNIGLVLRFNGEPVDPERRDDVLREINKPVVVQDQIDITGDILLLLNRDQQAGRPVQPGAGGTLQR
jgi:hypothetical protein